MSHKNFKSKTKWPHLILISLFHTHKNNNNFIELQFNRRTNKNFCHRHFSPFSCVFGLSFCISCVSYVQKNLVRFNSNKCRLFGKYCTVKCIKWYNFTNEIRDMRLKHGQNVIRIELVPFLSIPNSSKTYQFQLRFNSSVMEWILSLYFI